MRGYFRPEAVDRSAELSALIEHLLHRLERVLPAQAPIQDFVHHNTLHGYQHLPFREALASAEAVTGAGAYLPVARFREYFHRGRIDLADLNAALDETPELRAAERVAGEIGRRPVLVAGLLADFDLPPAASWTWRVEELGVLDRIDPSVPPASRSRLLGAGKETEVLRPLWRACADMQARPAPAPAPPAPGNDEAAELWHLHELRREAGARLTGLLGRLGSGLTLRGLLMHLTGRDILEDVRPYLVRHLAAHLDQGLAPWHNPARFEGFYAAWRSSARVDPHFDLNGLVSWPQTLERLPESPADAVLQALLALGLDSDRWEGYLESVAKELPGWSGMVLWRSRHPGYAGSEVPVAMTDYLAVRLVLEQVYAQSLCARHFKTEASLPGLRGYLRRHPAELLVRLALFSDDPPEWLADQGHGLVRAATGRAAEEADADWLPVARLLDPWRHGLADGASEARSAPDRRAWPLFLLCQHLGLDAPALSAVGADGARALLDCLRELTKERSGWVWLQAYERHYREQVFAALTANHGRGTRRDRAVGVERPPAQLIFCMDDREEGFRRHLEEHYPEAETLGAAAHFDLFVRYSGLGEAKPSDLCPVVARPSHRIEEVPAPDAQAAGGAFLIRRARRLGWKAHVIQGSRLDPVRGLLTSVLGAPAALVALVGKMTAPSAFGQWLATMSGAVDGRVATRLRFTAAEGTAASPTSLRAGFTEAEQADRVEGFLRSTGLALGLSPLVVVVGHGSNSQNNPHLSAYDCGACSGRHSGPNARLFAAMANRPEVRALLAECGLQIPADTWFVGCEHNTCDDSITWYDRDLLPATQQGRIQELDAALRQAGALHAQERCRRFMSAPLDIDPGRARRHVTRRRFDYSEARPELGHVNNACAFIGRRAATRGIFFDRRIFLISYDPRLDADGRRLERLLLANGPVGAGISLEYYFSTVSNERFGCGTKVVHNVAGLLGVMEGTASDLRTGLPRQMIEIHEAMRLLVLVEQRLDVLIGIYERQPALQELFGNGWALLAAKDPDSPAIHRFVPGSGWVRWQGADATVPTASSSSVRVRGQRDTLPPALIHPAEVAAP